LPETFKKLWDKKALSLVKEPDSPESIYSRAGIYAEFGKIICISVGFIVNKEGIRFLRLKSFYSDDEKSLLTDFSQMLSRFEKRVGANLCAPMEENLTSLYRASNAYKWNSNPGNN
jgi:hypothetical protein